MKRIIAVLCISSLSFLFGCQQQEHQAMNQMQDNKNITKPADSSVFSQHDTAKAASQFYLTKFSYTPETWARLLKNPEDRRIAARTLSQSAGSCMVSGTHSENTTATASGNRLTMSLWLQSGSLSPAVVHCRNSKQRRYSQLRKRLMRFGVGRQ